MENFVLIGITKTDNSLIRNRVRMNGAFMITDYSKGIQKVLAPIEKAKKILNELFPYHQLMKVHDSTPVYYFYTGSERVEITESEFNQIAWTLNII